MQVPEDETHRYGVIDPLDNYGRTYQVRNFVEKPKQGTSPSNLAIIGRYIFTPEIFMFLDKQEVGAGGEIQLTDGIASLLQEERALAYEFSGIRYDCGTKIGYLKATIALALTHPGVGREFAAYLDTYGRRNSSA